MLLLHCEEILFNPVFSPKLYCWLCPGLHKNTVPKYKLGLWLPSPLVLCMQDLACDLLNCLATDVLPSRPVPCHPAPEHEAREAGDLVSAIMDALDNEGWAGNSAADALSGAMQAGALPPELALSAAACVGQLVSMLTPEQQRGAAPGPASLIPTPFAAVSPVSSPPLWA